MSDEKRSHRPGDADPEAPEEILSRNALESENEPPRDAEALRRALLRVLSRRRRRRR